MTLEQLSRHITNINTSVNDLVSNAMAYITIESRAKEAHEYCQKYAMPNAWGRNIWHVILDDAIRMREEQNKPTVSQDAPKNKRGT